MSDPRHWRKVWDVETLVLWCVHQVIQSRLRRSLRLYDGLCPGDRQARLVAAGARPADPR